MTCLSLKDFSRPKPSGDLDVKIDETQESLSAGYLPTSLMIACMRKVWKIETVGSKGIDLIAEAVSSGSVQMARFQILDVLRAIDKGARINHGARGPTGRIYHDRTQACSSLTNPTQK